MRSCERDGCQASPTPLCSLFCLNCGYDLRGSVDSERCPECGVEIGMRQEPPGEPSVRSSAWRLWLPFSKPVRGIWFVTSTAGSPKLRTTAVMPCLLATLILGLAGFGLSTSVHQVEWVFAAENDIKPSVAVPSDTKHRPQAPALENQKQLSGEYSFGARSAWFGMGHARSGASVQTSTPGVGPVSSNTRGFRARLILPRLPIREHRVIKTWVMPSLREAFLTMATFFPVSLIVCFVNRFLLPRLLFRLNPSGTACRTALRQGFSAINRATCIGLMFIGFLWFVGTLNPGNWFIEYPGGSRLVGQMLLLFLFLGPAWVVVRGLGLDRARRVFPKRWLSMASAVLCHVVALVGFGVFATMVNLHL